MRVIIADDSQGSNAHTYIRLGFARAFAAAGHETIIWDIHSKSAIDMFDEFNPDLFWGQTYNLERGVIKAIEERPNLRVILTGSDWSYYSDNINVDKYPIVTARPREIQLVEELIKKTGKPDFICCHYHDNRIGITHEYWKSRLGVSIYGIPLAADIADYTNGQVIEEFKSDIMFIGGRWAYKSKTIEPWLLPLCSPELNLNVKIFGNRNWGIPQYCGNLETPYVRHMMKSAKVCPNVQELHAHDFGHDINERVFKLLSNKCPVVSDYSDSFAKDFFYNGEVEFAKTPAEFKEKCLAVINGDLIIDVNKGYEKVMESETYFHRVSDIFKLLSMSFDSANILSVYASLRTENNL